MQLQKNKSTYVLKKWLYNIRQIVVLPATLDIQFVTPMEMHELGKHPKLGKPEYVSFIADKMLTFYPTPDKQYNCDVYGLVEVKL